MLVTLPLACQGYGKFDDALSSITSEGLGEALCKGCGTLANCAPHKRVRVHPIFQSGCTMKPSWLLSQQPAFHLLARVPSHLYASVSSMRDLIPTVLINESCTLSKIKTWISSI